MAKGERRIFKNPQTIGFSAEQLRTILAIFDNWEAEMDGYWEKVMMSPSMAAWEKK